MLDASIGSEDRMLLLSLLLLPALAPAVAGCSQASFVSSLEPLAETGVLFIWS